jgi:type VI secretion system protein ImpA
MVVLCRSLPEAQPNQRVVSAVKLPGLVEMAPLDLSGELPDLDADAPAGPNLEFDGQFGELERAAQGKPEQQYGGTVIPAEEPNWKEVAAQAADLLDRTHDLRVLVHLAIARLQLSGLTDFVAVLGLTRHQLESRWEHVHPQLDPEDDNDPTLRANALLQLAEPVRVLRPLRDMPLAVSRRDGPVSWRMIGIANGTIEAESEQEKKTDTVIRAAFIDTGVETLTARRETLAAGVRDATAISAAFDNNSGYGTGPDLSNLIKLLQEMGHYIEQYMPTADGGDEDATPYDEQPVDLAEGDAATDAPARPRAGGVSVASLTSVNNRADALRLLDLVCRYYEQNEPSSPLPLLIGRARKLADKSFLEILQDLAPDGVMQAQAVVQSRDS